MNRVDSQLHLKLDETVADDAFGGSIMTCYQIWDVDSDNERQKIDTVSKHKDFEFVNPEDANLIVGRVGAGPCGKVFLDGFEDRSPSSHYFLKANKNVIKKMQRISHLLQEAGRSTVGCPSLSKNQLIQIYEEN